jgi:hypothetical protein
MSSGRRSVNSLSAPATGDPFVPAIRQARSASGRLRVSRARSAALHRLFVQSNSTTHRLDFNVRLRYAFAEGTDLWLVYNEGLDTDPLRDTIGVRSPTSLARTVLLKYTHTFGF